MLEYFLNANFPNMLYSEKPNPAPSPKVIALTFHCDGLKGSNPATRHTPIKVVMSAQITTRVIGSLNNKKDRIVTKAGAV